MKIQTHIEEKNRFRDFSRKRNVLFQEATDIGNIHQVKEHAAIREKNLQRDNDLAKAMAKMKRDEITQLKLR